MKGFADDSTIISTSTENHQEALNVVTKCCDDLALTLKPSKCVSLVYNGKKVTKTTVFKVGEGTTRNIATGPTKFLGQIIGDSPSCTTKAARKHLLGEFIRQLNNLDQSPIRGEFKLWIYKRYMVPSFHFHLAVNNITESTCNKMQATAMRKIKQWLGLTRSTTTAIIHHPNVIDIPSILELRTKAKLVFLSSINTSQDPMITELGSLLADDSFLSSQGVPDASTLLLQKARNSIASIGKRQLSNHVKKVFRQHQLKTWDSKLEQLTVQRKFLDITELEACNGVWNRIQAGLPASQLSFLLRAGSDTLPTPLNLKRWRMRIDSRCALCSHHLPITHHILSACPIALEQGRYTWRHDSTLNVLVKGLRTALPEARILADLPGLRAEENPPSTIPSELLVTTARPDIVVIANQEVTLVELTIPFNSPESLINAKQRKEDKPNYQLALSDLDSRGFRSSLITVEIGSLGHWLPGTRTSSRQLLRNMSKSAVTCLLDQAAKAAIAGSQVIFNTRQFETWNASRPLLQ